MNQPRVEQATLEDLPQLADLLVDLFQSEIDFKPDRSKHMRGIRLILENPARGRIFVVRQNGEILGMMNLLFTISTAEGGLVMILEDLVIKQDARGHGFGKMLLEHAIAYAKEKDFRRITLLTDKNETEAHKIFHQHGFLESSMIAMRLLLPADK
jgi:GNAT superfamily N-acetyltransferase